MTLRITAVFPHLARAQDAIVELRRSGLDDKHLSVITRSLEEKAYPKGSFTSAMRPIAQEAPIPVTLVGEAGTHVGESALKGLVGGAGVGALFGLAAALIPGVGPFIAAGALATALGSTGGAITAGAIVGATSGAMAAALGEAGWEKEEATFFATELEAGRAVVTIELSEDLGLDPSKARSVMVRHGGRLTATPVTA